MIKNLVLLLFIIVQVGAKSTNERVYELTNQSADDDTECLCQNGGICALDNDFCICDRGFTGKLCEVSLGADPQFANACADIHHGQVENHACSSCKCTNQVLTCIAYSTPVCVRSRQLQRDKMRYNAKRTLQYFLTQIAVIENATYDKYIDYYRNSLAYRVVYRNLDESSGEDDSIDGDNRRSLYVMVSSDKIAGLYFPQPLAAQLEQEQHLGDNVLLSSNARRQHPSHLFLLIFSTLIYLLIN